MRKETRLFEDKSPSDQNLADLFEGMWESRLPNLDSGSANKFGDPRLEWALGYLGGVQNKSILEIGPFEGFHTVMLERAGASSITSVESGKDNILKCLIVKELSGLTKTRFLLGDAQK